jgi:hypothetical protein
MTDKVDTTAPNYIPTSPFDMGPGNQQFKYFEYLDSQGRLSPEDKAKLELWRQGKKTKEQIEHEEYLHDPLGAQIKRQMGR